MKFRNCNIARGVLFATGGGRPRSTAKQKRPGSQPGGPQPAKDAAEPSGEESSPSPGVAAGRCEACGSAIHNRIRRAPPQFSIFNSPRLFVSLAAPKILPPGKMRASLLLPSLIRIFDFVEDTSPQQNCKQVCFCFRLIRTLASPKILPLSKIQVNLLLPSLIRIFAL